MSVGLPRRAVGRGVSGSVRYAAQRREKLPVGVADEQVLAVGEGEIERGCDVLVGGAVEHRDRAAQHST